MQLIKEVGKCTCSPSVSPSSAAPPGQATKLEPISHLVYFKIFRRHRLCFHSSPPTPTMDPIPTEYHIESLPPELSTKVFTFCPDPQSLRTLICSSLVLFRTFNSRKDFFYYSFLQHHIGPVVLSEATFCYHIKQIILDSEGNIETPMRYLR